MSKKSRSPARQASAAAARTTAELLEQCRRGDQSAAAAIFTRYVDRLTALARTRLSPRLAARLDADDIVMSAYCSFFVGVRERGFNANGGDDLWQLLVQITLRKLYRQVARHHASKRAVRRDVSLQLVDGSQMQIPDREPRAEEAAAVADELERILTGLQPIGQRVVELRLQGEAVTAIAAELRINERTVRRWLDRARQVAIARAADPGRREMNSATASEQRGQAARSKSRRTASIHIRTLRALPSGLPQIEYADFVLEKMIGAGANGKVYRARRQSDGQRFAVKFLRKSFLSQPAAVERFISEIALAARLDHPLIMPITGCGQTPTGGYFFAMELAGGDLQRFVGERIAVAQLTAWLRQAAEGLRYAHRQGIVHSDVKPSNLLLSAGNRVLVGDFGLAGRIEGLRSSARLAGTPAFMAPEQIDPVWGDVTPRTDIYGFGATLYALLTGRPPFVGRRVSEVWAQIVSAVPATPPQKPRRGLPRRLCELSLHCLAKHPADRPASFDDVITALSLEGQ